jgi:hypothetical protein
VSSLELRVSDIVNEIWQVKLHAKDGRFSFLDNGLEGVSVKGPDLRGEKTFNARAF